VIVLSAQELKTYRQTSAQGERLPAELEGRCTRRVDLRYELAGSISFSLWCTANWVSSRSHVQLDHDRAVARAATSVHGACAKSATSARVARILAVLTSGGREHDSCGSKQLIVAGARRSANEPS
jgi:hypothetical protein